MDLGVRTVPRDLAHLDPRVLDLGEGVEPAAVPELERRPPGAASTSSSMTARRPASASIAGVALKTSNASRPPLEVGMAAREGRGAGHRS